MMTDMTNVIDLTVDEPPSAPEPAFSTAHEITSLLASKRMRTGVWYRADQSRLVRFAEDGSGAVVSRFQVMSGSDCCNNDWMCRCRHCKLNPGLVHTCGACGASHPRRTQELPTYDASDVQPCRVVGMPRDMIVYIDDERICVKRSMAHRRDGSVGHLFW